MLFSGEIYTTLAKNCAVYAVGSDESGKYHLWLKLQEKNARCIFQK